MAEAGERSTITGARRVCHVHEALDECAPRIVAPVVGRSLAHRAIGRLLVGAGRAATPAVHCRARTPEVAIVARHSVQIAARAVTRSAGGAIRLRVAIPGAAVAHAPTVAVAARRVEPHHARITGLGGGGRTGRGPCGQSAVGCRGRVAPSGTTGTGTSGTTGIGTAAARAGSVRAPVVGAARAATVASVGGVRTARAVAPIDCIVGARRLTARGSEPGYRTANENYTQVSRCHGVTPNFRGQKQSAVLRTNRPASEPSDFNVRGSERSQDPASAGLAPARCASVCALVNTD